jgi:MFS family permease
MSLRDSRAFTAALVMLATFTDIVAYSVAVPVLPDLSRRLGASPTMIGLLFGSFGVTLLGVSMPMGAVSDRIGRKGRSSAGSSRWRRRPLLSRSRRVCPGSCGAAGPGAADASRGLSASR